MYGFRLRAFSSNGDAAHQCDRGHDILDKSCVVIFGDWLQVDD
jgi:hypothetical protein